ncbi:MAG: arginyltransferase [Planctomycetota bacterium]|jgi:arginine-tRNA-protein transferase
MTGPSFIDLIRFTAEPSRCSYLDDQTAQLEYRVPMNLNAATFQTLLERGWRRFGNYVFRPQCPVCRSCRSIRVRVTDFSPSKSQRRSLRRNEYIDVEVTEPDVTDDHVDLFNAYHRDMSLRRGWPENSTSFQDYYESFIGGRFDFAREFRYWNEDRLVGIGIVDEVSSGLSSAYFYHDPAWRRLSPGTFSVLTEIEYARQQGLDYVYLGYWIRDNDSMNYKANFRPHEVLTAYVDESTEPDWQLLTTDHANRRTNR